MPHLQQIQWFQEIKFRINLADSFELLQLSIDGYQLLSPNPSTLKCTQKSSVEFDAGSDSLASLQRTHIRPQETREDINPVKQKWSSGSQGRAAPPQTSITETSDPIGGTPGSQRTWSTASLRPSYLSPVLGKPYPPYPGRAGPRSWRPRVSRLYPQRRQIWLVFRLTSG